jgi:hypothetical protein
MMSNMHADMQTNVIINDELECYKMSADSITGIIGSLTNENTEGSNDDIQILYFIHCYNY